MAEEKEVKQPEETKEEPKEVKEFKVVEVSTASAPAIKTPEGEYISEAQAIVMLLNEVKEVKNLVG